MAKHLVQTNTKVTAFGKKILAQIAALQGKPYVKTGFPQAVFPKTYAANPTQGSTAYTVGQVAMAMEFGTSTIPERSFLRSTAAETRPLMRALMGRLQARMAKGELTVRQALSQAGAYQVGKIKQKISSGVPPPNKPATIARKGSSTPLIDTGEMRATVNYEVVLPKGDA